jgi:ABC-type Zn uptake system ZnuABC Zn-binding protein ZnuA
MKERNIIWISLLSLIAIFVLVACSSPAEPSTTGEDESVDKLKVVATTTIVRDVVSQIGADHIDLTVLLPVGTDPHSFDPTPQDIAKVAEADLVFANGAGLEEFLDPLIESAGAQDKVIHVSEGIDFLMSEGEHEHDHEHEGEEHEGEEHHDEHEGGEHEGEEHHDEHEGEEHEGEEHPDEHEGEEHDHEGIDPHTWTTPNNVMVWVHNIEHELSEADPENAQAYAANAEAYEAELEALDAWIREQVEKIPVENRKLVTDHTLFGYFAAQYGFEQVGALIPSYSTLAEPSAQELAAIEDAINELNVKAIFVGNTVNPALAERVAEDTGTQLIFVYTGSLTEPDGEAPTYLDYMRYNTRAFVDALK